MTIGSQMSLIMELIGPELSELSVLELENLPKILPRGSVVRCLTRNPGVLGTSTGETQESMNNVSCCRDMTEILLKAA